MLRGSFCPQGNYLRIRGEKAYQPHAYQQGLELPPHTRRKGLSATRIPTRAGTTSAYAEKSVGQTQGLIDKGELPPHTRRKVEPPKSAAKTIGTTSAYAEKSAPTGATRKDAGNYLRIRGEKGNRPWRLMRSPELPPHTRRKGSLRRSRSMRTGTTSAYAEKSPPTAIKPRGGMELPPHTRRKDEDAVEYPENTGTTSAYAEKSSFP
ncbi:Uncharacterised protein [Corynebacterium ulcerans]|nr:Uncharacterised protein [Corynebacterium ulcerans]